MKKQDIDINKIKKDLEKKLKYEFKNPELLKTSLTHPSYTKERLKSYQRLEFLGDSVLSLAVCKFLYENFQDAPEGKLSKVKSYIVSKKSISDLSLSLSLDKFIILGKGEQLSGGARNSSVLADIFEAIVGVIFLESGFTAAYDFILRHLSKKICNCFEKIEFFDYKSQFQNLIQEEFKVQPKYKVVSTSGPDHKKTFLVSVEVLKKIYAIGKGKSKKEAEVNAAKVAVEKYKRSIE